MFKSELNIEFKLFKPTSCKFTFSKRDLRDYPFLPDLTTLVLDNFANTLIDVMQQNAKFGGLNTE